MFGILWRGIGNSIRSLVLLLTSCWCWQIYKTVFSLQMRLRVTYNSMWDYDELYLIDSVSYRFFWLIYLYWTGGCMDEGAWFVELRRLRQFWGIFMKAQVACQIRSGGFGGNRIFSSYKRFRRRSYLYDLRCWLSKLHNTRGSRHCWSRAWSVIPAYCMKYQQYRTSRHHRF